MRVYFLPIFIVFTATLGLASCNGLHTPSGANRASLTALLIDAQDMPQGWITEGAAPTALEMERSPVSSGIAFFPEASPAYGKVEQDVYGFNTEQDAHRDFSYAVKEYSGSTDPQGWGFRAQHAKESHISCRIYPNITYPVCHWIARYDSVVVQLTAWIIPGYMTIPGMQRIAEEIDAKAERVLSNP